MSQEPLVDGFTNAELRSFVLFVVGLGLVIGAVGLRCSTESRHRFQDEYAPGATANAAESTQVIADNTYTSLMLFGVGSLLLILREFGVQSRRHEQRAPPAEKSP